MKKIVIVKDPIKGASYLIWKPANNVLGFEIDSHEEDPVKAMNRATMLALIYNTSVEVRHDKK